MSSPEVPIFVAQGSFGAVFRPAKDREGNLLPGMVAKVFGTSKSSSFFRVEEKPIQVEIAQNEKIRQFDPEGKFTLLSDLSFKEMEIPFDHYDLKSVKLPSIWRGCDLFHQIIYKDGGDDLETLFKKKENCFIQDGKVSLQKLLLSFRSLFEAIITMSSAQLGEDIGFTHMDISDKNIVVDGEGRMRFVDFGIGRKFKDCYEESDDYFESYHYYPPELKLFAFLNDKRKFSFRRIFIDQKWRRKDGEYSMNEFRKKFLSNLILDHLMESPLLYYKYACHLKFVSEVFDFTTISRQRQIIAMINDFFFTYSQDFLEGLGQSENPEDDDIWIETRKESLGIPASYSKFYNIFYQQIPKIDVYALGLVLIRTLGNCVQLDLMKKEEIPINLIQLLDSMTTFNCFRRVSPRKALDDLDRIIDELSPELYVL